MRCFYHQDLEAVGLCKHCSRGICSACAAETEDGLACSGRHEVQVDRVTQLINRNAAVNGRVGPIHYAQLGIYVIGALVFALLSIGLFMDEEQRLYGFLLLLPAGTLGLLALANLKWIGARTTSKARTREPAG